MQTKWAGALVATFFAAVLSAGTTEAFTVTAGNHPQANEENLLLNSGLDGITVVGTTTQSGATFLLTGNETLTEPSSGQARVEAVDGSFTYLNIMASPGTTFHDIILNPILFGTGQLSGSLTFTIFLDGGGTGTSGPFALAQGSNFFTLVAGAGEAFVGVTLTETDNDPMHDVRQIRISGVCIEGDCAVVPPTTQVPAPAALSLLGTSMLSLAGFTSWRRRR